MGSRKSSSASTIRPIVTGRGGCIASDRITVDGCRVGAGRSTRQRPPIIAAMRLSAYPRAAARSPRPTIACL